MRSFIAGLAAMLLLGVVPTAGTVVSVAYAGSLVGTMEGPIKAAFERETGMTFAGEGKGSSFHFSLPANPAHSEVRLTSGGPVPA